MNATLTPIPAPDPTRATAPPADRARSIDEAATGMESLFVSLLLKQMRQTLEPGAMFGSDNGDVLGGLFDSMMGQHLAKAGGLGIARLLKQNWTPPAPTGAPRENVNRTA